MKQLRLWLLIAVLAFAVLLTLAVFALGYVDRIVEQREAKQETKQQRPSRNWIRFSSAEGGFSVMMPLQPVPVTNTLKTALGEVKLRQFVCVLKSRQGETFSYVVNYNEYPDRADLSDKGAIFNEARKGLEVRFGPVKEEKAIMLQGVHGHAVEIEGRTNRMFIRTYISDRRQYQTTAIVPTRQSASADTWRFLNSFHFETNTVVR